MVKLGAKSGIGTTGMLVAGGVALVASGFVVAVETGLIKLPFGSERAQPVPKTPEIVAQEPVNLPVLPTAQAAGAERTPSPAPASQKVAETPDEATDAKVTPAGTIAPPAFDLVRTEPGGLTLVSGVAYGPGKIAVLSGTSELADVLEEQDLASDGRFALFLDLELSAGGGPVVLSLRHRYEDLELFSEGEVIITPPPMPLTQPDLSDSTAAPQVSQVASTPLAQSDLTLADGLAEETEPTSKHIPELGGALDGNGEGVPVPDQGSARPQAVASSPDTIAAPMPSSQTPSPMPSNVEDVLPRSRAELGVAPTDIAHDTLPSLSEETAQDREVALETPKTHLDTPQTVQEPSREEPASDVPVVAETVPDLPHVGSFDGSVPISPTTSVTAPTVLLSSAEGIEVLQAAPLPPSQVALDTISYDALGVVQLSGRGRDDAFIRVYLDNEALTSVQIQRDGRWFVGLPNVDMGTYTLRVDQVTKAGDVISRVESRFKREDPALLEQARAAAQDASISAITVQPGNTLWAIARDRYGEGLAYVSVYEANAAQIRDPDLIFPGQIFTLPSSLPVGDE